jgi:hypothetical protein
MIPPHELVTGRHLIDNSTASPSTGAIRPCWAATTAASSPVPRWPTGPAQPGRNGYFESFNSRVRDESGR